MTATNTITRINTYLAGLMISLFFSLTTSFVSASEADGHDHGETDNHEEKRTADRVEITDAIAARAGIKTEKAGAGEINQTITVYGKAVADPGRISHIRARFPGTIVSVTANIGEYVEKGDVLAEVESNESLKRYALEAPFAGVITERHATSGELTEEQALFTVSNFDRVWAEFQVFPGQVRQVAVGQAVRVLVESDQAESRLEHLIPNDRGLPFVLARAPLDNTGGQWTPGLLLEGQVSVYRHQVPLVVKNKALQTIDGNDGINKSPAVFVKEGNKYEVRSLQLGRSDGRFTEVLKGLHMGDEYVVENSYLIKADLEKSGASHEH